MILSGAFGNEKKMPFEFGFISVKGTLIETQVYQEFLTKLIEKSIKINDNSNDKKPVEF